MNDFVRYIRKHKLTLADDVVITPDNLKMLGEFIGVSAISRVMHCFGDRGIRLHAGLIHDILYEKRADERFSDGYDIASELNRRTNVSKKATIRCFLFISMCSLFE